MKVTFLGAAEMVTGSSYLLEFQGINVLVDCGMFQGGKEAEELNFKPFAFDPADIDFLLLTHAHIDHSGRIPKLVKEGFKGKIITTFATVQLCEIMLPDSGYIQEMEMEWINRKRLRAGKPAIDPLYTVDDAEDCLSYFSGIEYNEIIELNDKISVRFTNSGHILGSAFIEMWVKEEEQFKIVFSGDLGNTDTAILQNPSVIEEADYLFIESTYGDRLHKDTKNKALALLDIITDTIERKGNVVIPSFAIERTQEILYELNMLKESKLSVLKNIPVYLDSPLAINATKIFENNVKNLNEQAVAFIKEGDNPFDFPNLVFTETSEESKAINFYNGSCIIISASGMCDAGRIKHHLKHNLWRQESSIVFVGYQAKETLGRKLTEGEKNIKIFGEEINVKSQIYTIDGFSGHADQAGLLNWISKFTKKPSKIFLVHGEEEALSEFSKLIYKNFDIDNTIPKLGQTIELTAGTQLTVASDIGNLRIRSAITNIDTLKADFSKTLEKLQKYMNTKDSTKLDILAGILENIEDNVKKLDNEIADKIS